MAHRRALIIAPLYDGGFLPALTGTRLLVERLEPALKEHGGYDVRTLTGTVTQTGVRRALKDAFDTEGEVLVYFYGHGCLRDPGIAILATSDGQADSEGLPANEVTLFAQKSKAREVVLVLDCCHAGAALSTVGADELREEASQFIKTAGRAMLAGCSENQQGWEVKDESGRKLGAFSLHVLDGLTSKGVLPGHNHVTASSLSNYVLEAFRAWNQTPICLNHETGERKCVITSNLEVPIAKDATKKGPLKALLPAKQEPLRINLPFKPSTTFVGRNAELDYLKALLLDGGRPIAVSATIEGLGGIGKTELVLQLLYDADIAKSFSSIVWLDAAGPLPPQWASVAQRLGSKKVPGEAAEILSHVTRKLDDRGRSLVVLDNATDWESVRRFIPDGYPLLVTTRTKDFGGADFYHRELGNLSDDSARDFLIKLVPNLRTDPALPLLIQALGGHALAIELAGHHIKDMCSASEFLTQLRRNQVVFTGDVLEKTHYQATVDACLEITWNSLTTDASRLLWRKASLFAPTSAHRDLLQASFAPSMAGSEREMEMILYELGAIRHRRDSRRNSLVGAKSDFKAAYAELRGCHVLARVEGFNGERWAMHRLVRDFARKRLHKGEIPIHAFVLSFWLREPTLPIAPEIPHFVAAILDFAREGSAFRQEMRYERQISHRMGGLLFETSEMTRYFRDELGDPRAVVLMFEGLRDPNEDVRIAAIRLMEQVGPVSEVLDGLASALDDPDPAVRELASETLSRHGGARTIEVLVAATEGPNHRARFAAVTALGLMGAQAHAALRNVVNGPNVELKLEASTLLAEQGDATGARTVLSAIPSSKKFDHATQRQIEALALLMQKNGGDSELLEGLAALLGKQDEFIRELVVRSLGAIKDAKTVEVLEGVLAGGNSKAKAAAMKSLGLIGAKAHVALRKVADEGEQELKLEAAVLLAEQRDWSHASLVICSLNAELDRNTMMRRVRSLQGLKTGADSKWFCEVLTKLLATGSWVKDKETPFDIAVILADRGDLTGKQTAKEVFLKSLKSSSWQTRQNSAIRLGEMRATDGVGNLIEALSDSDRDVRREVAVALGKIGDPSAQVGLEKAAQADGDDQVKKAAANSLKSLKRK